MFIEIRLQYLEWLYKAWTKKRLLVIQFRPSSKKTGENAGKSNIVAYIINHCGIEPYNLATGRRIEKTFKNIKGEKK